jgi:predicted RNA-binding protein YlxR (DUF448 family)
MTAGEDWTAAPSGPQRRCIVTGAVLDKSALVRLAVAPDGTVVPDVAESLPGRGLWLTATRETLDKALAGNRFSKAARAPVTAEAALADRVEALLARRCLERIGLARRAGIAAYGAEKVGALLRSGEASVVLAARDAAPAARTKFRALARDCDTFGLFSIEELSLALGRENVVHAALRRGPMAWRFVVDASRLAGFRPEPAESAREESPRDE